MKCARCGHRVAGASWYCAHCGAAITDLNVADSGRRLPLPPLLRGSLWLAATALLLVALTALAIGLRRRAAVGDGATALPDTRSRADLVALATPAPVGRSAGPTGPMAAASAEAAATAPSGTAPDGADPRSPGLAPDPASGAAPDGPPGLPAAAPLDALRRPGAPIWTIRQVAVPPAIDGRLEDWIAPFTLAEAVPIESVIFGADSWAGPNDLGGRALAAWDPTALYLGLAVQDDVLSQGSTGNLLYRGDSVELQLDADLAGDFDDAAYSDDDWQLGISPGELVEGGRGAEAWVWRPGRRSGAPAFPIAAQRTEAGYLLEAAIPWSLFGIDPALTRAIGFALNLSDNDGTSPEQQTLLSSSPARLWGDPRSFGTLVLER